MSLTGILGMLLTSNIVYTAVSTLAGSLSDRIERRKVIVGGCFVYALIYLGFSLSQTGWHIWVLYALYDVYYGLAYGTAKAMIADIVPPESLIAGILWNFSFCTFQFVIPSVPFS